MKKIAIVGVSSNRDKYGFKIFMDLLKRGYDIFGVNPNLKDLNGIKIYPSIKDLPEKPHIVIIVVPPQIAEKIVDECIEVGVEEIWFQPGSESESAVEKSKKAGIKAVTACFMVSNGIW